VKIEVVVLMNCYSPWEALSSSRSRLSNDIYLTEERWNHITEPNNHPGNGRLRESSSDTIRLVADAKIPQSLKYRYSKEFDLVEDNTNICYHVLFRFSESPDGKPVPNNHIVTAESNRVKHAMVEPVLTTTEG